LTAVIVTGGGTGIGAAVTRLLCAGGSQVAIFGRRAEPLRAVASQTGAVDVVCDVSDADQVASCVAAVAERFGRLDGLVLNAGVMVPGGVAELSAEDFQALVAVNLTGAFLVAKAALPHLLRQRGAVVAVASVAALRASNQMGGYAVTKAGLAMLTQSLAVDHAHQGLRANVVCPGWTITEMGDEEMAEFGASRGGLGVDEAYELATSLVPQRRAARAQEVAAVVCWLLSDAASYVNGAVIPVDGAGIAVDVGTVPYDPRVQIRRYDGA
jgi:meso-butanediol dehydrogenase / (S,S)-butanediol dehydrogenase / diacetyl reductase